MARRPPGAAAPCPPSFLQPRYRGPLYWHPRSSPAPHGSHLHARLEMPSPLPDPFPLPLTAFIPCMSPPPHPSPSQLFVLTAHATRRFPPSPTASPHHACLPPSLAQFIASPGASAPVSSTLPQQSSWQAGRIGQDPLGHSCGRRELIKSCTRFGMRSPPDPWSHHALNHLHACNPLACSPHRNLSSPQCSGTRRACLRDHGVFGPRGSARCPGQRAGLCCRPARAGDRQQRADG